MRIKAIILDVDGVIVGERIGFNSPWPNLAVTEALKNIRHKGIPICLITAKPSFAIRKIIQDAQLHNPHITDGGAVVIDPIDNVIVKSHTLEKEASLQVLETLLKNNIYTEFYTVSEYFVSESQVSEVTSQHEHILQRPPVIVSDLLKAAEQEAVIKIMPVARDVENSKVISKFFEPFLSKLNLYWAVHPIALPRQFGIVLPRGIDKTTGVKELVTNLKLSLDEILGVGDSTSDWQFLQHCKYVAAMGNASEELKSLVRSKPSEYSFIAPSVDENGILEIFKHWDLG